MLLPYFSALVYCGKILSSFENNLPTVCLEHFKRLVISEVDKPFLLPRSKVYNFKSFISDVVSGS